MMNEAHHSGHTELRGEGNPPAGNAPAWPGAALPAGNAPPAAPLLTLASLVDGLAADAEARSKALEEKRALGPVTGLSGLDRALGGYLAPGLHIVHGSPGVGKTAFGLGIAESCGCPALFVSCEIGPLELMRRLIARMTTTYLGKLKTGELTGNEVRDLAVETAALCPFLGVLDATTLAAPTVRLAEALATIRLAPGASDCPGVLLVVDSAHTWAVKAFPDMDEYERLGRALDELEALAHRSGAAVLLIAERNRASAKTGGQGASAGNRRFEYAGETVIELDRDERAPAPPGGERPMTLRVSKNRHGDTCTTDLLWEGRVQRHREA